jgi:hypothetical protein
MPATINSPAVAAWQAQVSAQVNAWNAANPNSPQIDPNTILGIMAVESSGNPNAVNSTNSNGTTDYGLMQLNSGTFPNASGMTADQNIAAGVNFYGQNLSNAGGNVTRAVQAYNPGDSSYDMKVGIANGDGSLATSGVASSSSAAQTYDSFQTAGITNPSTVLTTQPVTGQPISDTSDLYPPYVVTEGLDATPWWLMKGGVTENPWLKQVPAPVTFEVMLPNRTMLSNTKAGNSSGTISIRLNASVSSFEVQSGHVVNKGLSRTGMHITMWGQEADLISGEANTGAFMNALGITSFLSVSNISAQLQSQIAKAFTHSKASLDYDTSSTSNSLRIAARDAFMELLALFKANGVVWFRNSTTGSGTGATNPVGVDAFSPQTGLSNYQMNARTNDVMARGQVIMKFRNSMYLGYFKSLEYEMEAERPFYWKFRFVFQVEKTLTLNYIPMVVNTQAPYGPNSDG